MNNKINLPLIETVKRSFVHVLKNLPAIGRISSVFLILWLFCIAMELNVYLAPEVTFDEIWQTELLCKTLTLIASTIVAVSFIRYTILNENIKWFHLSFGMNNIKFIGWNIFFLLIVFLPSFFIFLGAFIAKYQGVSLLWIDILLIAAIVILFVMSAFICRLYLLYTASAINTKLSIQKAFALTKGNTLKIFCGAIILVIPTIVLSNIVVKLYQSPNLRIIGICVLSLASMAVYFFDSCVKASYYTHLYQFFTYFENKPSVTREKKVAEVDIKQETVKPAQKKAATKKKSTTAKKTETTKVKSTPVKKEVKKATASGKAKVVTEKTAKKPASKKATPKKAVKK